MIIKFVFKAIVVEAEEWNPEVKAPLRMDNASQVISVFTYLYLHQSDFDKGFELITITCCVFLITGTDRTGLRQDSKIRSSNSWLPASNSGFFTFL